MEPWEDDGTFEALQTVAPGTPLRAGVEHIISARTGALIVIGDEAGVERISNGGFTIGVPYTPQALFELAKMDGAITLDEGISRILKANVHLVPDPSLPTSETGMRHRTAERVSRETDALVISVSQRRDVLSIYQHGNRVILDDLELVLAKVDQALQTLQRYRTRLDEVSDHLTALEFEDVVTLADAAMVIRRAEMVLRVAKGVQRHVVELGTDGRLARMQAVELTAGVEEDYLMLLRDYVRDATPRKVTAVRQRIGAMTQEQLSDTTVIVNAMGYSTSADVTEQLAHPSGFRLLRRIPRLPGSVINRVTEHFGTLRDLVAATEQQVEAVEGIGLRRARAIVQGLRRLSERAAI
jgi:diadenylate cyclase